MTSPLPQRPSIQITANKAGSIILIDNLIETWQQIQGLHGFTLYSGTVIRTFVPLTKMVVP